MPRGEAARRLPIVLQADSLRSQPDLSTVAEGRVEFRRGELSISADRLSYDTPRRPGQRARTCPGGARGRRVQRARTRDSRATLRGLLPRARIRVHQARRRWPRGSRRLPGRSPLARHQCVLHELPARRPRGAGLGAASAQRQPGPRRQRRCGRRRRAALPGHADPGTADAELPAHRRAQVGLAAAGGQHRQPQRRRARRAVLLEHRAQPRCDHRPARAHAPWPRSGHRVPLPRADRHGPAAAGVAAAGPRHRRLPRGADMDAPGAVARRAGLPCRTRAGLRRRLVEGLSERRAQLHRKAASVAAGPGTALPDTPGRGRGLSADAAMASAAGDGFLHRLALSSATPQLGVRLGGGLGGWRYALETEYNRFTLPSGQATDSGRYTGDRLHLVGNLSRPLREPGWWVVPRLSINAASYFEGSATGPRAAIAEQGSRAIPTFSIDGGLELERDTSFFGRPLQQTLEPRLLYVNTPYRAQSQFPNYDSAAKDFSFASMYAAERVLRCRPRIRWTPADGGLDDSPGRCGQRRRGLQPDARPALPLSPAARGGAGRRHARRRAAHAALVGRAAGGLDQRAARLGAGRIGAVQPRPAAHGAFDGRRALVTGALSAR